MSRYLLDGRPLQDASAVRGVGTYLRGLLSGYRVLGAGHDISLILQRGTAPPAELAGAGFGEHPARLRPLNRHVRPVLDPLLIRRALNADRPGLYHAVEYAQPLLSPVPVVVTVHDLIPFVMPREYPWMRRERILPLRQVRHAEAVIAVSESTADDLRRLADVDPARISVIPEGVQPGLLHTAEDLASLRVRLHLPKRFVLAVGTFDPRKRVRVLTDVVRRLRVHHDVGLVIAGFQGNFASAVDAAVRRAGIGDHTRILGHVESSELSGLYQLSECLLFTSAYEGFGLPPLEAMAVGTPVAVFDNSSLREVVGDAALLARDGDATAMAGSVAELLADPEEQQRVARRGRERATAFTWERTAAATLAVYERVLSAR